MKPGRSTVSRILLACLLIVSCSYILIWYQIAHHMNVLGKLKPQAGEGSTITTPQQSQSQSQFQFQARNVLILVMDNRLDPTAFSNHYYWYSLMINIFFAEKYKYTLKVVRPMSEECRIRGIQTKLDVNWCKIEMLAYYLNLYQSQSSAAAEQFEWICLLDSDALLSYFGNMSLFDVLDAQVNDIDNSIAMIVAEDYPLWQLQQMKQMLQISPLPLSLPPQAQAQTQEQTQRDSDTSDYGDTCSVHKYIDRSQYSESELGRMFNTNTIPPSIDAMPISRRTKRMMATNLQTAAIANHYYGSRNRNRTRNRTRTRTRHSSDGSERRTVFVANMGTIFMRVHHKQSLQIIQDWLAFIVMANSSYYAWTRPWRTKWPCEQALFNCLLLNQAMYAPSIFVFPYATKVINIGHALETTSFVNHITSAYVNERADVIPGQFKKIINQKKAVSNHTRDHTLNQTVRQYFANAVRKEKRFAKMSFVEYSFAFV